MPSCFERPGPTPRWYHVLCTALEGSKYFAEKSGFAKEASFQPETETSPESFQ